MSIKETVEYFEQGFSKIIENNLKKYLASHKDDAIPPGLYNRIINEVERVIFNVTLEHASGNQLQAAKILGINRNTLRKKVSKLNGEKNDH